MKTDNKKTLFRSLFGMTAAAAVIATAAAFSVPAAAQQQPAQQPQQPQQPPQVQLVEKAKHGDWTIRCAPTPKQATQQTPPSGKGDLATTPKDEKTDKDAAANAPQQCFMMQVALNTQNEKLGLSVMVMKSTIEGKVVSQLRINVPFLVLLPAGVGMEIDGDAEKARRLTYQFCPSGLCIAIENLTEGLLGTLKGGNKTKLFVWDVRGQQAVFELSLKGFTKAFEDL